MITTKKYTPSITLITCLFLFGLVASCTSTTIDEFRQGETGIESTESIVILGRRTTSLQKPDTDSTFVECVGERISRGENAINVVPEQEFIDSMFPFFESRTAPSQAEGLGRLLAEDQVATMMNDFGIRYMVWLDGYTETTDRTGSISCAIGPAGGGCFGFGTWEEDSSFDAHIWDIGSLRNVGTINADATGQSYLPALVVPIPLIARVEANACNRLATQLKDFLNDT